MTEQEVYDRKRRYIAENVVQGINPKLEDGHDPAAVVGGLILAATVLGMHHQLGDVFDLVSDDLERDMNALQSGEWVPGETEDGE